MTGREIAQAAQLACLLEASAPKPGNVAPGRRFTDIGYEHFLASAVAIGEPLAGVAERPLGETVRLAVEATARWAPSNTNLGIVLLLAPLSLAAVRAGSERGPSGVRARLGDVLRATTVSDARDVFAAIRMAQPGGLGHAPEQDVGGDPTVTLLEAMRLAADRDGIAREYATDFSTVFGVGAPALRAARAAGLGWDEAVVETFLTLLATDPDTHIARRCGAEVAADVSRKARAVLGAGGVRSLEGRRALAEMDAGLRGPGNTFNPGTTADLTAASIFVVLLTSSLSLNGGWIGDV